MIRILMDLFLIIGAVFALAGVVGMIRMPDVFCRMQASTCVATLGTLGAMVAGLLYAAGVGMTPQTLIHIIIIALMVLLTNPLSNHALLKGAYKKKDLPEKVLVCDAYSEEDVCETSQDTALSGEEAGIDE